MLTRRGEKTWYEIRWPYSEGSGSRGCRVDSSRGCHALIPDQGYVLGIELVTVVLVRGYRASTCASKFHLGLDGAHMINSLPIEGIL
jgi:hypothetical protein